MKYIGIDIGTTSVCGAVLDTASRRIVTAVTQQNRSFIRTSNSWERIQDTAKILAAARRIITGLTAKHSGIAGIGVTGQMHGIVYVDDNGDVVSPLYTWQDTRAGLPHRYGTYAERFSRITGYPVAPGFGLATHFYNLKNNIVPACTVSFCTIMDYIVMKLTGNRSPKIDATNAASFGVFDLRKRCFDTKALAQSGIDTTMLPDVVPSASIAGHWHGIPVVTALGDNQASFLGSVRNIERTALVNFGTGAQVSAFTEKFAAIDGLDTRPFPGGGYLFVGASLCGGKSYALLERFFRKTIACFGVQQPPDIYAAMNDIDYDSLTDRLAVDTRFAGTRTDPARRGGISNMSMDNLTPEHLIAGFLDGMVNELADMYRAIPARVRTRVQSLTGSGNGLRKNQLLKHIVEKRFGYAMRFPAHVEEAAVGAAMAAAVGTGHGDFATIGKLIRYE
ncbi:MAG: hypothetical protein HZC28_11165 [Spirochaetes bacterium]|nr:hypothetical protein [Spirochaetota bacterium]